LIESEGNLLLDALPQSVRENLLRHAEEVALPVGTVLFKPGESPRHVHLLSSGMASIVTTMQNGEAVEVGIVGREGFPESGHLLGPSLGLTLCFMQISGGALRINARRFRDELDRSPALNAVLLRFVQCQFAFVNQIAGCNRLHTLESRLARRLLMVQDKIGGSTMRLTQEILGQMLGARRPTVTVTAGSLEQMQLIEHSRGQIRILNRAGLEQTACECHRILRPLWVDMYKN
jgi:CRP-like cAMP-binding protein